MKKQSIYIGVIVLLLIANGWLLFDTNDNPLGQSRAFFDATELTRLKSLTFKSAERSMTLSRIEGTWMVDDTYMADQGFIQTLLSILSQIETGRLLDDWNEEIAGSISLEMEENTIEFQFAHNLNRTKTYFITEEGSYEVAVPGYRDNVSDVFLLHPDQWRDRVVVDGTWRTIQQVQVSAADREAFEIQFQDAFFLLNGKQPKDSTALIDYLNQFEYFQANEMVSEGRFGEMDSLAKTQPLAIVSIDDIKQEQPTTLRIYPNLPEQPYHLVLDSRGNRMVIDARRIEQMLTNPDLLN